MVLGGNIYLALISLVAGLIFIEAILRLIPSLVSVPLLAHFPAPLRHQIAERLHLPTMAEYDTIRTSDRLDHGPPLYHPSPNAESIRRWDAADLAAGAIEFAKMDARGFCNPPEKAARDHVDIVVVGDSFTTCTAVKATDTSSHYLEEMGPYTTYNIGVPNLGLYEYIELLRRYGLPLKPRVVVMNIYEGNDLRDAVRYRDFRQSGRNARATNEAIGRILSWSYAVSFLYATQNWLLADWHGMAWLEADYRYSGRVQGTIVPMNVTNTDLGEVRDAYRLKEGKISLDLWIPPLVAFKELSQANGFVPVVTYTPSMYTAYADTVVFDDPKTGDVMRYLSTTQREWLARKTAELGLAFIDLVPAFQKAAKDGPLTHMPANVHLSPYGHRLSAAAWRPFIAKLLGETVSGNAD